MIYLFLILFPALEPKLVGPELPDNVAKNIQLWQYYLDQELADPHEGTYRIDSFSTTDDIYKIVDLDRIISLHDCPHLHELANYPPREKMIENYMFAKGHIMWLEKQKVINPPYMEDLYDLAIQECQEFIDYWDLLSDASGYYYVYHKRQALRDVKILEIKLREKYKITGEIPAIPFHRFNQI